MGEERKGAIERARRARRLTALAERAKIPKEELFEKMQALLVQVYNNEWKERVGSNNVEDLALLTAYNILSDYKIFVTDKEENDNADPCLVAAKTAKALGTLLKKTNAGENTAKPAMIEARITEINEAATFMRAYITNKS